MAVTEIALYRPEIPPNTGNIARLSVCTGSRLHIIGKPGFSMDDAAVKRAGLDYWHLVDLHIHEEWEAFLEYVEKRSVEKGRPQKIVGLTRFAGSSYDNYQFTGDEILLFGQESSGFPEKIVNHLKTAENASSLRIPVSSRCRSLNLSNSVAILVFESLKQRGFPELDRSYQIPDQEPDL